MDGVFLIHTDLDSTGNINGKGEPVELFKKYRDVSIEQVQANNKFYYSYGTDEHLQDLVWSGQAV
jgi:aminoglycoside N3'-acetyltransferase